MSCYAHALVLVHDINDGPHLLGRATRLAQSLQIKITVAHISEDYREMNYVSDSLMDDVVAEEVIQARGLLSQLVKSCSIPVESCVLVTLRELGDIKKCVIESGVDLVIAGHRNRLLGSLTSKSMEYINHLDVDVLIHHIHD